MEKAREYHHDLGHVTRHTINCKQLIGDNFLSITNKITKKIRKYNHSLTHDDFKDMYIKYYIDGYLNELDFEDIIKDGVYHKFDFELCKSFFIEVYSDNPYLMKKFESKHHNYFKNNHDHDNYNLWLIENFTKYYQKYHKDDIL